MLPTNAHALAAPLTTPGDLLAILELRTASPVHRIQKGALEACHRGPRVSCLSLVITAGLIIKNLIFRILEHRNGVICDFLLLQVDLSLDKIIFESRTTMRFGG